VDVAGCGVVWGMASHSGIGERTCRAHSGYGRRFSATIACEVVSSGADWMVPRW
jgi:hypothetical protein